MTHSSIEHTLTATLLTVMAATTIALLSPAIAGAAESDNGLQVKVSYADLDLETDAGATQLYQRLAGAARRVCDDGSEGLRAEQAMRACQADTLARAVGHVGSAKLAALSMTRKPLG